MTCRTILMCSVLLSTAVAAAQAQPRGNPEHPNVKQLQWWGMIQGEHLVCPDHSEEFARYTFPVGDVNHDNLADWTCSRVRCDTTIDNFGFPYRPQELLLYKGVRDGLPSVSSGERIGPAEIGSETTLLASGDWDNDGNRDLAVSIRLFNDTTSENVGNPTSVLVIFWGSSSRGYSLADTTQLSCGSPRWMTIYPAVSKDLDEDGVDDLMIESYDGFSNGKHVPIPALQVFQGHRSGRWGRNGLESTAVWRWWAPPSFTTLSWTDQDCDGHRDIILIDNGPTTGTATVTVLYGRVNGLPDTAEAETISLSLANGHTALFTDVTGDGIPELAVNSGSQEKIKLFAGKSGQRLKAQYGTGIEPGNGRPWAEIWLPRLIHDGWESAGFSPLYDMGDVNLDTVNDLWTFSWPFLICYTGGQFMDSLIDAEFDTRGYGDISSLVRLGDIDGSGRPSFAMTFLARPGTIYFFRPTDSVPKTGAYRQLPHAAGYRCSLAAGVEDPPHGNVGAISGEALTLTAVPNPSRGEVELRWNRADGSAAMLTLADQSGREVTHFTVPAGEHHAMLRALELAPGIYVVRLTIGARSALTKIVIE